VRRHGLDHDRGERRPRGRHGLPARHRADGGGDRGHRAPRRPAGHAVPGRPPVLSRAPEGAIALAALLYGSTFPVIKDGLDDVGPFGFLAWRFLFAGLLIGLIALLTRTRPASWRRALWGGLVAGGLLAAGYALQTTGLERTSASSSGLVTALYLPLVPILLAVTTRRSPGAWPLAGVALASAGLLLVAVRPDLTLGAGDLLTAGSAVCFAGQILALDRYRDVPPVLLALGQMLMVGAVCALALPVAGGGEVTGTAGWVGILYTGLVTAPLAFVLQAWGQRRSPPVRTGVIFALEPVFAVVASALIRDERLGARAAVGGVLILAGIAATLRGREPRADVSAEASPRTAAPRPPTR
jgi:drug/metabolite transporter (DMT)-like permease